MSEQAWLLNEKKPILAEQHGLIKNWNKPVGSWALRAELRSNGSPVLHAESSGPQSGRGHVYQDGTEDFTEGKSET